MRELVLVSDLHGNAPALERVIDREGLGKEYIVLGDIMGLNSYPEKILELVRDVATEVIGGNHDKAIFHRGEGHVVSDKLSKFELYHTLSGLSVEQVKWMLELDYMKTIESGSICLTHAYPWKENASGIEEGNSGIRKREVMEVASNLGGEYDWLFHGHTHTQYSLDCSKFGHDIHFVNPGTLGYNGHYAVVDIDSEEVELKQVDIDIASIKDHISSVLSESCPSVEEWL